MNWKFAVLTYLEPENVWECVEGGEKDPQRMTKAKSKIILFIEPISYVHSANTASEVWKCLRKEFGLTGGVGLLMILM